jgi:pimeloyl-ACP methyl ester carboxylesterase
MRILSPIKAWLFGTVLGLVLAFPAFADGAGKYVSVPGAKLWYVDTGGPGEVLVLLHANTGTTESFVYQYAEFSKAGYRVIAFDRRGWGKSEPDPATGAQPGTVADDLAALVNALQLTKFHLIGLAGGGFVALDYAPSNLDKIRTLTIASSTGQLSDKDQQDFRDRIEVPELRKQHSMYREIGASYRGGNPEGLKRWLEIEEHARVTKAPAQPLKSPNSFAKISVINVPTLVIAGGADLISPPSLMRSWSAKLQDVKFVVVPEAGHNINWEEPEEFNKAILNFLREKS